MGKASHSWSQPDDMPGLIGRKRVDWSIFEYGTHLPIPFQDDFNQANNGILVPQGEAHPVTLEIEGQAYTAALWNIKREGVRSVTLQIRYDNNDVLKTLFRDRFKKSYSLLAQSPSEGEYARKRKRIVLPDAVAEFIDFYRTAEPFHYRLELKQNDATIEDPASIIAPDSEPHVHKKLPVTAIIVAYYLSKHNVEGRQRLGMPTWTKAYETFSASLGIKESSLKNLRDEYDAIMDNGRAGWYQKPLTPSRRHIEEYFRDWKEEDLRALVQDILSAGTGDHSDRVQEVLSKLGDVSDVEGARLEEEDIDEGNDEEIEEPVVSIPNPEYSIQVMAEETGFEESRIRYWLEGIRRKGQGILYGPPGTGKTYVAERLARHLVGGGYGITDLVQFHPAYAYEDFMQGLRPKAAKDGALQYVMELGRFLDFCRRAGERDGASVLIIDEINRAPLAQVFGELMYLLEYRDREIPLAGGGRFSIPPNVFIIGTMNTADRSIALVDHALRRRFAFLELRPDYALLRKFHSKHGNSVEGLITVLQQVNRQIADQDFEIGVSFFMRPKLGAELEAIWRMEIEPYLRELFFNRPERADALQWEKIMSRVIQ